MLSLPTILLILVLPNLHPRHSLIRCSSPTSLSHLVKEKKLVIRGIGLLQDNSRLLLVYEEAQTSPALLHLTIAQLEKSGEEKEEVKPMIVRVPAKAKVQSVAMSSLSTSALGGFILQSGASTFGWAHFVRSNDGNVSLEWYRHAATGEVAKVSCTYASFWMKEYVTEIAIFSRSEPAVFAYLATNNIEILPGSYSVTEGAAGENPIISISTTYVPRRIEAAGKSIEGGFFHGQDLYAVDNVNHKVYLYRLGAPTGTTPAAVELTFEQFIHCTEDAGITEGSSGGNWLYIVVPFLILALIAFLYYACSNQAAKVMLLVNHRKLTTNTKIKTDGKDTTTSSPKGGGKLGSRLFSKSTQISTSPATATIDSETAGKMIKKTAIKQKTPASPKQKYKVVAPSKLANKAPSAVAPAGSIFTSSL